MNIENMKIISIDDNKTNLLIIESYAKILKLNISSFLNPLDAVAVINDLPLGRNIDEMIRMVDTMLFTNEHGEVCPAGWSKGDEGMKADKSGVAEYLAKNQDKL